MACAGAFYVAPWPLLYYPLLILLAGLSCYRLDLAVLVVPIFAPFFLWPKQLALGPHTEKSFPPAELLLLLELAVGVVLCCLPGIGPTFSWRAVRRSPFIAPAALLLAAGTLSTLLATDRHQALEWYRWTLLEPIGFFVLLLALRMPSSRWRLVLLSVVAAGLLAGTLALLHVEVPITAPSPGVEDQLPRIRGPYGSADNLGLLFDRAVPIWLALSLLLSRKWWVAGLILMPALLLTFSRGAWVAVLFGCLLVLALSVRWGRWIAMATVGGLVLAGVVGGPIVVHALQTGHAHTVERRLGVWKSSVAMIRDHPVVGVGPDNFIHYYAPTRKENRWQTFCRPGLGYLQPDAGAEPCLSHPHNVVLDFWLSIGLAGLIAFLWLQAVFWRSLITQWHLVRRSPGFPLLVGCAGAMVAALVHGLVDESYFLPDLALIFWLLCAVVSAWRTEGDLTEEMGR